MAYSTGIMDKRVTILSRGESTQGDFGMARGAYVPVQTIWAAVTFNRGVKSLREGAIDAYDTVMVRCRWHDSLTRDCRLSWDNRVFQIDSFNGDRRENTIQITCTEIKYNV